jgi:ribosome biogenesis protein BMS1
METFEFLSALQIHGFPRLLGVATHMDFFRENKQKKKMQKELRKRFEIEVPPESKLFFIKSLKKGLYDFRDIHNLSRFISVIIPRKLDFKEQHPHLVVDRIEQTEGQPMVFGYVRGNDLIRDEHQKQLLLSGMGMVQYEEIRKVHDPCPVGEAGQKRGLRKHEKVLYAPQSDIGLAVYDETGDYVQIPDKHVVFTKKEGQDLEIEEHTGVQMMRDLQGGQKGEDDEEEEMELMEGVILEEEEEEEDVVMEGGEDVGQLAMRVHQEYKDIGPIQEESNEVGLIDLNRLVYPENFNLEEEINEFSKNSLSYLNRENKPKTTNDKTKTENNGFVILALQECEDSAYFYPVDIQSAEFYQEETKCRFVTGFKGNESDDEDSEAEFEDEEGSQGEDSSVDMEDYESDEEANERQKEIQIEQVKDGNSRLIKKGSYVRIQLNNIPDKIFKKFKEMPVILSQVKTGETQMGYLMVKFKRHRFYRNLLKTNDPLIVSLNFNKYQTVPYFCRKDFGQRLRMLKYTPKHEFCLAVFYGNYVPAQTGVIAFQTISKYFLILIF